LLNTKKLNNNNKQERITPLERDGWVRGIQLGISLRDLAVSMQGL
jgi:hypothetical protein